MKKPVRRAILIGNWCSALGCKATNPEKHTSGKLYCGKHWPKNEPLMFAESILDGNDFKCLLF